MAEGNSAWVIGELKGRSHHTVRYHVKDIYRKLDASTQLTAILKAFRMGLINPANIQPPSEDSHD